MVGRIAKYITPLHRLQRTATIRAGNNDYRPPDVTDQLLHNIRG
jgi:hypothetical protein